MKKSLSRRDLLKLFSTLPLLWAGGSSAKIFPQSENDRPNIILLVLDAMSAEHLGLYGYPRRNTPNLQRFAEHAVVYHRHYAAGNFTVPGTASLLTGTYPWTHRAFQYAGHLPRSIAPHNFFNLIGKDYYRIGYGQNPWADLYIQACEPSVDWRIPTGRFNLNDHLSFDKAFANDPLLSFRAIDELAFQYDIPSGASLLAAMHKMRVTLSNHALAKQYADLYPLGLPHVFNFNSDYPAFLVEDVIDGLIALTDAMPLSSAFAYFHIYPPHGPFYPRKDFVSIYKNDGFVPARKPDHPYAQNAASDEVLFQRQFYDQYIAFTDAEFGRLYEDWKSKGIFENNYVIITTDHGDLFERGIVSHTTPVLYEPLIHIPLLISAPGQRERIDVRDLTSAVDLLPTLLHIAGRPAADLAEGQILPALGGTVTPDRAVYAVEAKTNSAFAPLTKFTIAMLKDRYKFIHYEYPDYQADECYDLENDPEEINNLSASDHPAADDMLAKLKEKLIQVNEPFLHR